MLERDSDTRAHFNLAEALGFRHAGVVQEDSLALPAATAS